MTDDLITDEGRDTVDPRDAAVLSRDDLELTLRAILPAGFLACAIAISIGVVLGEWWLVATSGPGAAGFAVAYVLMRKGTFTWAAWAIVVTAAALVTVSAAIGLGLRDSGVLAYPVIVIFAGMTLSRRGFALALALIAAALAFLAVDQLVGLVPIRTADNPQWADVLIIVVIMSATLYAVWLLSRSARRSLATAHREIDRRRAAEHELMVLSTHDPLTGVFNRRFFDAEVARLRSSRHGVVSVIVADVDGLKAINDELGHSAGDQLLIHAAELLGSVVRADDVLARIGGDEFAILLPGTDADVADAALGRIEAAIATCARECAPPVVHLSMGVATSTAADLEQTLALADTRMYARKVSRRAGLAPQLEAE